MAQLVRWQIEKHVDLSLGCRREPTNLGTVVHDLNHSTGKAEKGESLELADQ